MIFLLYPRDGADQWTNLEAVKFLIILRMLRMSTANVKIINQLHFPTFDRSWEVGQSPHIQA
jgi:hypothetical protein